MNPKTVTEGIQPVGRNRCLVIKQTQISTRTWNTTTKQKLDSHCRRLWRRVCICSWGWQCRSFGATKPCWSPKTTRLAIVGEGYWGGIEHVEGSWNVGGCGSTKGGKCGGVEVSFQSQKRHSRKCDLFQSTLGGSRVFTSGRSWLFRHVRASSMLGIYSNSTCIHSIWRLWNGSDWYQSCVSEWRTHKRQSHPHEAGPRVWRQWDIGEDTGVTAGTGWCFPQKNPFLDMFCDF